MTPDQKTDKPWESLTYSEKNARMIEREKGMLAMLRSRKAISGEDYTKAMQMLSGKTAGGVTLTAPTVNA